VATPVILDVDAGVDDALALLFAARHPGLDLRAVTCVAGNAAVDQVVTNTLTVLDAAGAVGVPVARGAERPLLEPARPARHVHGEDGLGDVHWPAPPTAPDPRPAVELLRDELLAAPRPITLVTLAPLTNIALLLRAYPQVAAGIERIVFMGGAALRGNATAAAEFNVWHDPEAAAIVLDAAAGIPMTMYGLDVFYGPVVSVERAAQLAASDDPGARLAGELLQFSLARYAADAATIGDAGAVCAVADPGGLHTEPLPVRVELAGTWTRGQTVVDQRRLPADLDHDAHGIAQALVDVALGVDGPRYAELWRSVVAGGSSSQSQSA
jgi:pyrimidine-specific ribonucleoside hydrolase